MRNLLIVTIKDDIHAYAIAHYLRTHYDWATFLLEVDQFSSDYLLSYTVDNTTLCRVADGSSVSLRSLDVVWWRRSRSAQSLRNAAELTAAHIDLINNDCRAALRGALSAHFSGKWVSDPLATEAASFKPFQLQVAHRVGLRIPETLISSNPTDIRKFVGASPMRRIIKPVSGTKEQILYTQEISDLDGVPDISLAACPAIYQQYVEGTDHLRVSMFGDSYHCALIPSYDLDWRGDLTGGMVTTELPPEIVVKLRTVLEHLRLEMGIFDLKKSRDGDYYFFEVNPQGQFLFVEGIVKANLTKMFCDFINRLGESA
jgi:glutathione synthase/RimK-type ligase-like ATP-grasp enzyme